MLRPPFFRDSKTAPPVFAQNRSFFQDLDQSQEISSYDYVVLDTELTGLKRRHDQIVAIGAVKISNLRISADQVFFSLVRPTIALPKDSTLVHGITPQQLKDAPELRELLPRFLEFCGPALLVGHYVNLDVAFLSRAARRLFGCSIRTPCLDTMRLAEIYKETSWEQYHDQFNLRVSYNLTDLSREYGLPAFTRHDALQDALQTAYLFLFLIKKLQQQGYTTLKDLYHAGESWRRIF